MKKILNIIGKYGLVVMTPLVLITFLKTCGTNGKVENVRKEVKELDIQMDSLKNELIKEIKLEGLKSEKRMIQSTDRKMLDVSRQSEIDKEIEKLSK